MAQKVVVELVDDLDGTVSDDINTVRFGLDGVEYEIDLTEENANRLRDELADFITAARRTGGRIRRGAPRSGAGTRPTADRERTRAIREWARAHGYELAERGRIPADIITATTRRRLKLPSQRPGEAGVGLPRRCPTERGSTVMHRDWEPPRIGECGGSRSRCSSLVIGGQGVGVVEGVRRALVQGRWSIPAVGSVGGRWTSRFVVTALAGQEVESVSEYLRGSRVG